jgi:hypothetical protein
MDWRYVVIPLWCLEPLEEEETEVDYDPPDGVVTMSNWNIKGEPVWAPRCEVCLVDLTEDEVDLCARCESKFYPPEEEDHGRKRGNDERD